MFDLVSVFIAHAHAQAEAAAPSGQPSIIETMFPFLIIFVIFFFLVIRPQAKKAKEHTGFLANLKKGDKILTSSGIYGTVEGLTDKFADISIADNVRIKVLKSQVAGYVKEVE
jgi:preprotein translocase subunit YajC